MSAAEQRNCNQVKGEENQSDDESLQEKCWQEEYKGASRKWLIRDASGKTPRPPLCSTMKEAFVHPIEKAAQDEPAVGVRKKTLLKKFYEEAIEEVLKEQECEPEANDYCTEYDGNFKAADFQPDESHYLKDANLHHKYPLYGSQPVSYYSFNQQKDPTGHREILHGLTKFSDVEKMFRRNDQFSKPVSETFYAPEV